MIIRPTTQRRAGGQAGIAYVVGRARPHLARHLVNHWPPIALRGRHQWPAADRIKRQRGPISGCRPYAIGLSGAIRFMLLTPLSPMSACVSGIAAPVLTHPGRCRINFSLALRHEPGSQALREGSNVSPCIGSLRHALSFRRSHVQEVRQVTQGVGYVVTS